MKPKPVDVTDAVIAINVNQTFRPGMSAEAKYDFTRGVWRIDAKRASKAMYAFMVYQGVVKEVYEIHSWNPAGTTEYMTCRKIEPSWRNRFEFVGRVAPANVRDRYLGRALPEKHGQNPIRYYNC